MRNMLLGAGYNVLEKKTIARVQQMFGLFTIPSKVYIVHRFRDVVVQEQQYPRAILVSRDPDPGWSSPKGLN